jgi:glycosyltransferase involved in cell wall biosynthesis
LVLFFQKKNCFLMRFLSPGGAEVSVVVPLYNHAAFIGEAIDSILAQGALVREVIVIDDGSTDESAAVMQGLAGRDARIRFLRQENRGAHATLNRGIGLCRGTFCAILNSDDVYTQDRLARLVGALRDEAGADIAASGIGFIDGAGQAMENEWYRAARAAFEGGTALDLALLNGNFLMTTSNIVFRRAAWPKLGGFAPLRYAHDLDWLLRALAHGHRIRVLPDDLLRYRTHGSNTIAEDHGAVRVEWALVAAAYLASLWHRPGAAPIDWAHAGAAQSVLRRHELDRGAALAMAALRREGAVRLDTGRTALDSGFKHQLKAWL